jgi:hypothetical protein
VDGLAGSPVTFEHTATAGAPSGLSIVSGDDQTGPVSTELPLPIVVALRDGGGNPVPGAAVSWVIGLGGGSVIPATSSTDATGQATAAWTLGSTPGVNNNTVSAVVSGIGVVEFSATATAGAPARLSILTPPSASAVSGAVLGQQPVIQLLDAGGNPATQSGVAVQVVIATGGGSLGGATSILTDANGRAAFVDLSITGVPGARTLRFTAANFAAVTSGTINLTATPTVTTITADTPDPSRAGDLVTVSFTVASANGTPSGSVQVADGDNTCTGTLSGGQGSCAIGLTTTGSRTLTATYAGAEGFGASSDTESHTVEAPPPPMLAIATQPASQATSGVALNPQPVVQLKTGDGADLATAGVAVSVAIQGGGSLGGTTPVATDGNGRATFTDLVITGDPGTRTLLFTASGFTSVTSSTITLVAAPPSAAQSSIVASPSTIMAGSTSTITVTVRDAGGNLLGGRTVTPQASGSGNTIDPASAVTGADGTAAFSFSSTTPEAKTISASVDGVDLNPTQVTVEAVPTSTTILGTNPAGTSEATGSFAGSGATAAYEVTAGGR